MSMKALKSSSFGTNVHSLTALPKRSRTATRQITRAGLDTQIVVSTANAVCLAVGRFGFLSYQRRTSEKAGKPEQNGKTHADAGDFRAQEVTWLTATNDPAGFNLVDLLAWGSIGHIVAFCLLATNPAINIG